MVVRVDTRSGSLQARVWQLQVGRVRLLLLDSNVEGNSAEDRELTSRLYGGDDKFRIRQELLLGIGGARILQALKNFPGVLHLNEGHSAFAILEEIRRVMEYDQIPFDRARRRVSLYTVFTTHTPIPAGHDRFSPELVEEHLGIFREKLGLSHDEFMALGRVNPGDSSESFLHDGVGFEKLAPGKRSFGHTRGCQSPDVAPSLARTTRNRSSYWPHYQRSPRIVMAGTPNAPAFRNASIARLANPDGASRCLGKGRRD